MPCVTGVYSLDITDTFFSPVLHLNVRIYKKKKKNKRWIQFICLITGLFVNLFTDQVIHFHLYLEKEVEKRACDYVIPFVHRWP